MSDRAIPRLFGGLLALLLAAGCAGGGQSDEEAKQAALAARLAQIDKRLTVAERRVESLATLAEQVRRLESRVVVEARSAPRGQAETIAPPGGSPSSLGDAESPGGAAGRWSRPGSPGEVDNRPALTALAAELQAKLADLKEQFGDDEESPARQKATNDLYQWYGQRVRELMGQDPARWDNQRAQQ